MSPNTSLSQRLQQQPWRRSIQWLSIAQQVRHRHKHMWSNSSAPKHSCSKSSTGALLGLTAASHEPKRPHPKLNAGRSNQLPSESSTDPQLGLTLALHMLKRSHSKPNIGHHKRLRSPHRAGRYKESEKTVVQPSTSEPSEHVCST